MRSVLITNPERVAESLGDYQHSPVALAFQQPVGRHRSAHLDRVDLLFRDRRVVGKAEELAKKNGWFLCRQLENEANANMHSKMTAVEILEQIEGATHFVAGVGTGGTITGVGRRLKEHNPDLKVVAVAPEPPM